MRPARVQAGFEQRASAPGSTKRATTRYVGAGLSASRGDGHARPLSGGTPDGRVDGPFVGLHRPRREHQVLAPCAVGPELLGQRPVGTRGAGHHHEPRGALVQTVHDPGPVGVAAPRLGQADEIGKARQQAVHQRPAVVAGAVVHDEPGRLVHHDQLGVLVHHGEGDRGIGHRDVVTSRCARRPRDAARSGPCGSASSRCDRRGGPLRRRPAPPPCGAATRSGAPRRDRHGPRPARPGTVTSSVAGDRGGPVGAGDGGGARHLARSARHSNTAAKIPPTTMHESATLNVGQKCSAMKSITEPRGWSGSPGRRGCRARLPPRGRGRRRWPSTAPGAPHPTARARRRRRGHRAPGPNPGRS